MFAEQFILALIGLLVYYFIYRKKNGPSLPPGPKPLPIVGNLYDLPPPGVPEYRHWLKLRDQYGPISSVTVLGQPLIIIQDRKAAHDIFDKMWLKTSARPKFEFADKLCGYEKILTSSPYDSNFRRQRKCIDHQIGSVALASKFGSIQEVEARRLLLRCLNDPHNIHKHFRTEAGAIILKVAYGYSIEPEGVDPLVELIDNMMTNFSVAFVPLAWVVDTIPALQHLPDWLPGTGFKKTARQMKKVLQSAAGVPYSFVRQQMANGVNRPSYVSELLEHYGNGNAGDLQIDHEDEEAIIWTAALMYGGGADTTVSSLSSFILAMILFPEVQRKAQEEIDRVVGDRLPKFEDQSKLPYIQAILKETARWFPVTPIPTSHAADEDIIYNGYLIPKGAILVPATWHILHDPETYSNPSSFEPERFLAPRNEPDARPQAFGYGRRRCPGRWLAESSLFMTITMMLFAFKISKPVDENGVETEPQVKERPGIINHPGNFPCTIVPRSARHAELIRSVELDHPWERSDSSVLDMQATR
ncbi:Cytochrome P450 monooxygenase CLM2 [Cladobotryum mycophilum]|uniref:Cytochrome P450 monooxygenase CLM2 n=1 Tax=Cladobotryum mycophilum TaxID=491253 RepID=A0ABR0SRF6_9HYPO